MNRNAHQDANHRNSLVARSVRYLKSGLAGKLINLPLNWITDEFAFSLNSAGWNFYTDLLSEHERRPDIGLEETRFFRFFTHEHIIAVQSLNDLLFLHDPSKRCRANDCKFYLGTWPWGGLTRAETLTGGTPFGWYYDMVERKNTKELWGYGRNLWYQPNDKFTLQNEMHLTLQLLNSLRGGYSPVRHLSFPLITLLVSRRGERRGVIVDGHHRLAILSHLRHERATVEVAQVIREEDVGQWYYVKRGDCTAAQALEIFDAFFVQNGMERLRALQLDGLPDGSNHGTKGTP